MKKERNTIQKKMLINYLKENSNKHLNIENIHDDLKEYMGKTTIYRIINDLINKNLVLKVPHEDRQGFCYLYNQKEEACNSHYHLVCEKCNKLYHFECKDMLKVNEKIKNLEGFDINTSKTVFYGVCKNCK